MDKKEICDGTYRKEPVDRAGTRTEVCGAVSCFALWSSLPYTRTLGGLFALFNMKEERPLEEQRIYSHQTTHICYGEAPSALSVWEPSSLGSSWV